jgi:hypothetical protein
MGEGSLRQGSKGTKEGLFFFEKKNRKTLTLGWARLAA